jgi:uncharacterized repeat protein (TIGR01451 family)
MLLSRSSAASAARRALGLRPTLQVGRSLLAALAFVAAPALATAQSGTSSAPRRLDPLDNQAVATYSHDGIPDTAWAGAMVIVARQAALSLTGPFTAVAAPAQRRVLAHRLTNRGSNADVFTVSVAGSLPWPVALYRDVDANGQLSPADRPFGATVALDVGASVPLLLVVDVPATAAIGSFADVTITALSNTDARASAVTIDRVTVIATPVPDVTLTKTVDRAAATIGDTLQYTITFANVGDGDAPAALLADTLPGTLRIVPGTLVLDGRALTDSIDGDAGAVRSLTDGRSVATATLGLLLSHTSGTLTFSAVVAAGAVDGTLANVAVVSHGDSTRTVARSGATSAVTAITLAALGLTERLVGTPIVTLGAQVHIRLTYTNNSTVVARNAVLADTLPAQLAYESSVGGTVTPLVPDTTSAPVPQVVTWALGDLAPGATGARDLFVRVVSRTNGQNVSDHSYVSADNARTQRAQVSAMTIALFDASDLTITKTTSVLDVAIGDAVPYTVTVHNTGSVTLRNVVVRDRLPDGMRYAPKSLTGADSATVVGQDLSIFVAPLAADATATIRYAAVLATPAGAGALENRAMAEAENGLVRSDTARAVVTQRRQLAMRERTMIGKVWLDRNDDGVQQQGEEGVAGVQVWDTNGDVALTDKEGRYSFRNVATGTHALRLDPIGIPKDFVLPSRADEVIVVRADGWSLPNTSIRLIPRAGAPTAPCACDAAAVKAAAVTLASLTTPAASADATPATAAVVAPRVAPLLDAAARAAMVRRELVTGPGMRLVAPFDGVVLATPRFFASVRGTPGTRVGLYDGATLLSDATLRGDGVQDFLNVELEAGPHHLRVVSLDSSTAPRGDSIMVHVSGVPNRFVLPADVPPLRRDAAQAVTVRVQVLDAWNVPVANQPMITIAADGAAVDATDQDASSVGRQLHTDAAGWLTIPVRAGQASGTGELRLAAAAAKAALPLRIFASVRPLLVTGMGQVGVGGAPAAFGAVTVQGAVTEATSLTVSYDSRRGGSQDDFFQRGYDPLGDEQMPTVGDNSSTRSLAPTTKAVSARLEHGMDWLAAGDVQTVGFGRDGELGAYRRSLTGVSSRLGTGAFTWHGFGSMTQQAVERTQLRGNGSTGPYLVGGSIRAGTDAIAIEVRARDNAARVVTRQQLARTTDYQIDPASGTVLLRLPIPSVDAYGNPVYLVATVERLTGGAAHFVGGLRMDADAARMLHLGTSAVDSLVIGVSGVRDGSGASGPSLLSGVPSTTTLLNADLRLRRGALSLTGSVLRAQSPDSSGVAGSTAVRYSLPGDRLVLDGRWMSVGAGLGATDPRLASALTETSFGMTTRFDSTNSIRFHWDESRFIQYGVTRSTTGVTAEQMLRGRRTTQDLSLVSETGGATGPVSAVTARIGTSVSPTIETWVDGTRLLSTTPVGQTASRPNQFGTGITFKLPAGLKLDASHHVMKTPGDSVVYGVTSAQLRADAVLGGQVWTGFEQSTAGLHDEVRAGHSALLGWNQRLPLGAGWSLTSLYERRIGLSRAALTDPARALPFAQAEQDRWSAAAGLGWMPGGDRARLTVNAEMQNGQGASSSRFQLSGDAALNAGLALIALNDWSSRRDAMQSAGAVSRQDRSLLGLAMRPVSSNSFNALAKFEWRRSTNATGSALLASSGRDLRMIGTSDIVWAPVRGTELSARYAARITTSDIAGDSAQRLHVADHFAGARIDRRLVGALHVRADGRMLMETESRTALWNAAPSLLYDVQGRLVLETGYRFGALRDPDFAAVGGAGAFATIGFRFTEGSLANPAAFWRDRIANDR